MFMIKNMIAILVNVFFL